MQAPVMGDNMSSDPALRAEIIEEDLLRAHVYRLLAKLMRAGPDQETLTKLTNLTGDETELGKALGTLAKVAGKVTAAEAAEEYQDLFIGVGRGELLPYGSYYLTGFLNEKPLAKLRNDMRQFGIERRDAVSEPEDHIAALCEMMAGLVTGDYGEPLDLFLQVAAEVRRVEPRFASRDVGIVDPLVVQLAVGHCVILEPRVLPGAARMQVRCDLFVR